LLTIDNFQSGNFDRNLGSLQPDLFTSLHRYAHHSLQASKTAWDLSTGHARSFFPFAELHRPPVLLQEVPVHGHSLLTSDPVEAGRVKRHTRLDNLAVDLAGGLDDPVPLAVGSMLPMLPTGPRLPCPQLQALSIGGGARLEGSLALRKGYGQCLGEKDSGAEHRKAARERHLRPGGHEVDGRDWPGGTGLLGIPAQAGHAPEPETEADRVAAGCVPASADATSAAAARSPVRVGHSRL
jgi:hypothetical protein